jgi:hypothetical protein
MNTAAIGRRRNKTPTVKHKKGFAAVLRETAMRSEAADKAIAMG